MATADWGERRRCANRQGKVCDNSAVSHLCDAMWRPEVGGRTHPHAQAKNTIRCRLHTVAPSQLSQATIAASSVGGQRGLWGGGGGGRVYMAPGDDVRTPVSAIVGCIQCVALGKIRLEARV